MRLKFDKYSRTKRRGNGKIVLNCFLLLAIVSKLKFGKKSIQTCPFCQKSEAFKIAGPLIPLCVKSISDTNFIVYGAEIIEIEFDSLDLMLVIKF